MEPSLYHLPEPKPDELPRSWMLRCAGHHGVSLATLLSSVKIRRRVDCDVEISHIAISRLLKKVDIPSGGAQRIFSFFSVCRGASWVRRWLRTDPAGNMITSYCPECLIDDAEPYWRAVWRFRFWVICPVHRRPMLEACFACGLALRLKQYETRVSSYDKPTLLTRCLPCGTGLDESSGEGRRVGTEATLMLMELQRSVASAIANNGFRVRGVLHKFPLSCLPGLLLQGIQADDGLEKQMDPRASALLRSALSNYWLSGTDGLYLSRKAQREQTSLLPSFLGGPESYADLAITKRFEAGWE